MVRFRNGAPAHAVFSFLGSIHRVTKVTISCHLARGGKAQTWAFTGARLRCRENDSRFLGCASSSSCLPVSLPRFSGHLFCGGTDSVGRSLDANTAPAGVPSPAPSNWLGLRPCRSRRSSRT